MYFATDTQFARNYRLLYIKQTKSHRQTIHKLTWASKNHRCPQWQKRGKIN